MQENIKYMGKQKKVSTFASFNLLILLEADGFCQSCNF